MMIMMSRFKVELESDSDDSETEFRLISCSGRRSTELIDVEVISMMPSVRGTVTVTLI